MDDGEWFRNPESPPELNGWSNYTTCVDLEDLNVSTFASTVATRYAPVVCMYSSPPCTLVYLGLARVYPTPIVCTQLLSYVFHSSRMCPTPFVCAPLLSYMPHPSRMCPTPLVYALRPVRRRWCGTTKSMCETRIAQTGLWIDALICGSTERSTCEVTICPQG